MVRPTMLAGAALWYQWTPALDPTSAIEAVDRKELGTCHSRWACLWQP
ncbi:hypothetical protein SAMN05444365_109113 [Micromonospora pattaloongensis]|uniref:Uncharacterized protein n=1 Tax=Micromonospora pattaloongensis TaxID=405436 RepID=A0A1H3RVG6_9ACTN|nr:hypothetical protein SAMN05444365_109113 [Micromonospora pattaloongensis]